MSRCAICGTRNVEGAHVKARAQFTGNFDDRRHNILPLCPTHHDEFDLGRIAIDVANSRFIIFDELENPMPVITGFDLRTISAEYVTWKNQRAHYKLRFRLGIIPGCEYGQLPAG